MNVPKAPASAEVRKAAPLEARLSPAPTPTPGAIPPTRAAAPQAPADARKASEIRRPGSVSPQAPRPVHAAPTPAAEPAEEDPEKLLREYAERQKTKVLRLEQQLAELKKVQAEREAYRIKGEALARELTEARRHLEASSKSDAVIKDLQGKVDAALLSSSMDKDELGKLRAKIESLEAAGKKAEERAAHFEKVLSEAQKQLVAQSEGRREAETRVAAALQALQGEISKAQTVRMAPADPPPAARHPEAASAAQAGLRHAEAAPAAQAGKPVAQHVAAHAAAPKPGISIVKK